MADDAVELFYRSFVAKEDGGQDMVDATERVCAYLCTSFGVPPCPTPAHGPPVDLINQLPQLISSGHKEVCCAALAALTFALVTDTINASVLSAAVEATMPRLQDVVRTLAAHAKVAMSVCDFVRAVHSHATVPKDKHASLHVLLQVMRVHAACALVQANAMDACEHALLDLAGLPVSAKLDVLGLFAAALFAHGHDAKLVRAAAPLLGSMFRAAAPLVELSGCVGALTHVLTLPVPAADKDLSPADIACMHADLCTAMTAAFAAARPINSEKLDAYDAACVCALRRVVLTAEPRYREAVALCVETGLCNRSSHACTVLMQLLAHTTPTPAGRAMAATVLTALQGTKLSLGDDAFVVVALLAHVFDVLACDGVAQHMCATVLLAQVEHVFVQAKRQVREQVLTHTAVHVFALCVYHDRRTAWLVATAALSLDVAQPCATMQTRCSYIALHEACQPQLWLRGLLSDVRLCPPGGADAACAPYRASEYAALVASFLGTSPAAEASDRRAELWPVVDRIVKVSRLSKRGVPVAVLRAMCATKYACADGKHINADTLAASNIKWLLYACARCPACMLRVAEMCTMRCPDSEDEVAAALWSIEHVLHKGKTADAGSPFVRVVLQTALLKTLVTVCSVWQSTPDVHARAWAMLSEIALGMK